MITDPRVTVRLSPTTSELGIVIDELTWPDCSPQVAWCKKYGVPLEKMFAKTLRTKFGELLPSCPSSRQLQVLTSLRVCCSLGNGGPGGLAVRK